MFIDALTEIINGLSLMIYSSLEALLQRREEGAIVDLIAGTAAAALVPLLSGA